eukprot:scaffold819_cov84-Phaeocystis_antarctica.AAC.2
MLWRHNPGGRGRFNQLTFVLHHHLTVNPWERPTPRIRAQRLVRISVAAAPDDATVLGRPVAVDVVGREVALSEGLHDLIDGLSAECTHAQAGEVVACKPRFHVGHRHQHTQKGGARLENSDAVTRNHASDTVRRRGGRAVEKHGRHAAQQRRCDH